VGASEVGRPLSEVRGGSSEDTSDGRDELERVILQTPVD
jgi:hypothetical protein